jgi:hypothetical protein
MGKACSKHGGGVDLRTILDWVLNRIGSCGLDSSGSG